MADARVFDIATRRETGVDYIDVDDHARHVIEQWVQRRSVGLDELVDALRLCADQLEAPPADQPGRTDDYRAVLAEAVLRQQREEESWPRS